MNGAFKFSLRKANRFPIVTLNCPKFKGIDHIIFQFMTLIYFSVDFGCQASFTTRITNPEAVVLSVGEGASKLDLCKSAYTYTPVTLTIHLYLYQNTCACN